MILVTVGNEVEGQENSVSVRDRLENFVVAQEGDVFREFQF